MFDSVDMRITRDKIPGVDLISEIPQYLTEVNDYGTNQFGEYLRGTLGTLKIGITQNSVKVYNSSLCKFFLGNNFQTLSKGDTRRAIEQIGDQLHLPMKKATVTRIDFGTNLIMNNDEKLYYPLLGSLQYYNRLPQPNGLYYTQGNKQLCFYGKIREAKHKGKVIPPLYIDRNVLRYELRFKKRIREIFNQNEITTSLLYDESFYSDLVAMWWKSYHNIQKINNRLMSIKPTGSTKQLQDNLTSMIFSLIGQDELLDLVKQWQKTDKINKKQASDHRKLIKKLASLSVNGQTNELLDELNKKMKEASHNW